MTFLDYVVLPVLICDCGPDCRCKGPCACTLANTRREGAPAPTGRRRLPPAGAARARPSA